MKKYTLQDIRDLFFECEEDRGETLDAAARKLDEDLTPAKVAELVKQATYNFNEDLNGLDQFNRILFTCRQIYIMGFLDGLDHALTANNEVIKDLTESERKSNQTEKKKVICTVFKDGETGETLGALPIRGAVPGENAETVKLLAEDNNIPAERIFYMTETLNEDLANELQDRIERGPAI